MERKQRAGDKISESEITVVLQGSTLPEYGGKRCIERSALSVRQVMPRCQIIVSTWEGEDIPQSVQGVVDKVIFNKDPGGSDTGKPGNVNRQLVSSLNGLKQAQTKYALKMRSDFVMKSTGFLKYFDVYRRFDESYRLFEKRLVCGMSGTAKPTISYTEPFRVSDFFTFGLKTDLMKLYDIPLVCDEDFFWFTSRQELLTPRYAGRTARYCAEQDIWIGALRKHGFDVKCQYLFHYNDEIAQQSERYVANNFCPVVFEKAGILPLKGYLMTRNTPHNFGSKNYGLCYTQREWQEIYKRWCDSNFRLALIDWELFFVFFVHPVHFTSIQIKKLVKLIVGEGRYSWLKAHLKKAKPA